MANSDNQMTPNLAQGANTAMEQAAGLANALYKISKQGQQTKKPSETEVSSALGEVAKKHFAHINTINQGSYFLTRMHSRQGWAKSFYGRYIYPRTAWSVVPYLAWLFSDSVAIDYLPLPAKPIGKAAIARAVIEAAAGGKQSTWNWAQRSTVVIGSVLMALGASFWFKPF